MHSGFLLSGPQDIFSSLTLLEHLEGSGSDDSGRRVGIVLNQFRWAVFIAFSKLNLLFLLSCEVAYKTVEVADCSVWLIFA